MQVHIAQKHSGGGIYLWKNYCCFINEEVQRKTLSTYAKCLPDLLSTYSGLYNILELWNSILGTEIYIYCLVCVFLQKGRVDKQDDYKVSKSGVKVSFFQRAWYVCSVPVSPLDPEELRWILQIICLLSWYLHPPDSGWKQKSRDAHKTNNQETNRKYNGT